jgi:hypothetical protein
MILIVSTTCTFIYCLPINKVLYIGIVLNQKLYLFKLWFPIAILLERKYFKRGIELFFTVLQTLKSCIDFFYV